MAGALAHPDFHVVPNFVAGQFIYPYPGQQGLLFSAESPTSPQASISMQYTPSWSGSTNKTFQIKYTSAPTAVVVIQSSMTNVDADFINQYTSTNLQDDAYTDEGVSNYYRAKLVSGTVPAGGLTVIVIRA